MARILVVDDSMYMRRVLRDILERAGHVVTESETGEAALKAYAPDRFDLLTVDLVMPGMGGLELLRRLAQADPDARTVVVTAVGQQAEVQEAIALGAREYVTKPFEATAVVEAVASALK